MPSTSIYVPPSNISAPFQSERTFQKRESISSGYSQRQTHERHGSIGSNNNNNNNNNNMYNNNHGTSTDLQNDAMLSRTMTGNSSIHSASTQATSFDTNWLPDSQVVPQPKKRIVLTLTPYEMNALRKSWNEVISGKKTRLHRHIHHNSNRNSKQPAQPAVMLPNSNASSAFTSSLFCVQFYQNLISMQPTIEKLIPSIKHQASAFAGVINVAMSTLEDLSRMNDSLDNLGRLHSRILGIDSPYFQIMGDALIKTFRDRYQSDNTIFELPLEEAWIKLYCFLANSILQGGIDPIIEYGSTSAASTHGKSIYSTDAAPSVSLSDTSSTLNNTMQSSMASSRGPSFSFASEKRAMMMPTSFLSGSNHKQSQPLQNQPSSTSNTIPGTPTVRALKTDTFSDRVKTSSKRLRRGVSKQDPEDPNCIIM